MIFFYEFFQKEESEIIRINLDDFSFKIYETNIPFFLNRVNIWNDKLLVFGLKSYPNYLYQLDLNSYQETIYFINYNYFIFNEYSSHFIHQDYFYITTNDSLYQYDLINNVGKIIEYDLSSIIKKESTMFYNDGSIYYFGGVKSSMVYDDLYRINIDSFDIEKLDIFNLPVSYGQVGFFYQDSFIIYGFFDSDFRKYYGDLIRISLPKQLNSRKNLKVYEKFEKDIRFYFSN